MDIEKAKEEDFSPIRQTEDENVPEKPFTSNKRAALVEDALSSGHRQAIRDWESSSQTTFGPSEIVGDDTRSRFKTRASVLHNFERDFSLTGRLDFRLESFP